MSILRFINLLIIVLAIPILIVAQEIIIDSSVVDATNQTVSPTTTNSTYITPPEIQIVDILPGENTIDTDIEQIKQNTSYPALESQGVNKNNQNSFNTNNKTNHTNMYPFDDDDPVGEDFDPSAEPLITVKEGSYTTAAAGLFSRSGQQQQEEQFNNNNNNK
eukprot:UN00983